MGCTAGARQTAMTAISQMIGPPRGPFPESRISAPFRWAAPRLAHPRHRPRAARKGDWPNRRERQLDSPLGEPKRAHHAGASGGGHRVIPPRRGAAGKAVRGQARGQGTGGMSSRTAQAGLAAELSDLVLCLLGQCTNRVYHRFDGRVHVGVHGYIHTSA